jgi:pimeloyl-ACP methyl ester carboxylesterase
MRAWLRRIGYTPIRSTIAINAGCPLRLRDQIQAQIARQQPTKTARLALIGHSRGGVLAWSIAVQMREQVSHLAVLGSPLRAYRHIAASGGAINPPNTQMGRWLREASDFARRMIDPGCDFPGCECSFIRDMARPISPATSLLAVVSGEDEVVPPEATAAPTERVIEVGGGHAAMVYNPKVYRAIGDFLAAR